jgi:hypothetical protein
VLECARIEKLRQEKKAGLALLGKKEFACCTCDKSYVYEKALTKHLIANNHVDPATWLLDRA